MNDTVKIELEELIKKELLLLNLKYFILKKAKKRFNLPEDVIRKSYSSVMSKISKAAFNRGFVYLLLSSIFLFVGIKSLEGNSEYIYLGGLLFGSGGILTSLGYFILGIKGKNS